MSIGNYQNQKMVAIDAQNVAFWPCRSGKAKDWGLVLQVAKYYHSLGHTVAVFVPIHFWISRRSRRIDDDIKKELKKCADIHEIDCGQDSERDDKMMIAFSYLLDAYYVSNDKGMSSHFKLDTLENRAWCHSRRIEFSFDVDGKFVPCLDIESMDGKLNESSEQTTAGKEVRL